MNINEIINTKQWVSEVDNVMNELYNIQKPKPESDRINYNLIQLVLVGRKKYQKELASGKHYCHDCSSDYGRPIYHYNETPFKEFRIKWSKYGKSLQELAEIIY